MGQIIVGVEALSWRCLNFSLGYSKTLQLSFMRHLHFRTKGSSHIEGFFTEEALCAIGEMSSSNQERSPGAFNSTLKESDVSLSRGTNHIASFKMYMFFFSLSLSFYFLYPDLNKIRIKGDWCKKHRCRGARREFRADWSYGQRDESLVTQQQN